MNYEEQSAGPSGFGMLLQCNEFLTMASPSTSSTIFDAGSSRSAFTAYQQSRPNGTRLIRQRTPERILNTNFRTCIYNQIDPKIQLDYRALLNLMSSEEYFQSNHHYFTAVQEHITPFHREQAVDWLYDVAKEEKCDGDVLLSAIAIIDRFLSGQNIFKHDMQILAGVAMFIASKLKASHPINADKIGYYSDDSCKVQDILSWELMVITQLEWEIESPTAFDFFDQLTARLPAVNKLRDDFQEVVHRCQKMHKLATLFPSMQCAIALYYAATVMCDDQLLTAAVKDLIGNTFKIHEHLLQSYVSMVEKCLSKVPIYAIPDVTEPSSSVETTPFHPNPIAPPPSSQRVTPPFDFVPAFERMPKTPTTPLNDSGFCSDVSSPESTEKKRRSTGFIDDDNSPPKMVRMH